MDREVTIYQCSFQAYIQSASVLIKFPCTYFLEWKTANNKACVEGKTRPSAVNSHINFQQVLTMHTELIYDNSSKKFVKKETLLNLNLVSKSRQNQVKLVGRVTIDLAEIANDNIFQQLKTYRLSYCSVDGEITFSSIMKSSKLTNLTPHDLDTSSYKYHPALQSQYLSFCSFPTHKDPKRHPMADYDQETSLEFAARRTTQNAIDLFPNNQRTNRHFNQTFFIMPSSPRQNSFNRTSQLPKATRQKSLESETVYSVSRPQESRRPIVNVKQTNATSVGSKEGELMKERDKVRSREEIDGNRQKVDELERKIIQLCANLQDSKRQVQLTERQNKEKQELIQKLKTNSIEHPKEQLQLVELQARYDKMLQQLKQQETRSRATEQALKKEITLTNAGNDHLRRQTEQLRKIWVEKKEYYEEKIRHLEYVIKEKESKLNQFLNKIEELSKFKYQYELIKQLNDEKESKIKMVEKDLLKMSKELEELKRNNLGEENLKLKINCSQSAKNIEQLGQKYAKCEEQVSRYKQNYIKISTAYEIQSKNYESNKEKYVILQSKYYEIQKENIELKNTLGNLKQQYQQSLVTYEEVNVKMKQYKSKLQEQQKKIEELQQEINSRNEEKNNLRSMVQKLRVQNQIRGSEYQNELKRVQTTFMAAIQAKQKSYNIEKKQLEQALNKANQLQASKDLHHQQQHQSLLIQKQQLSQELGVKDEELKKKLTTIQRLNEAIADKQQIIRLSKQQIEGLKQANKELGESISRMKEKEKQMNQTIVVLEEQSQKILQALEQKEQLDRELDETKHLYQVQAQKNQALTINLSHSTELIAQLQLKMNQFQFKIDELQSLLSFKTDQLLSKQHQLQSMSSQLQEEQATFQRYKSEASESLHEVAKLKQIIKQINQRYEEHLRVEEKYAEELNSVRQEKEEIEGVMSNQLNQVVGHNHELQNRMGFMEQEFQRLEQTLRVLEEEKKQTQELYNQSHKAVIQTTVRYEEAQEKINNLNHEIEKLNLIQAQKERQLMSLEGNIQQSSKQIQLLILRISELQQAIEKQALKLSEDSNKKEELQRVIAEKARQTTVLQQTITQLQNQLGQLRYNQQQPYNQQIIYQVNTVQEEHPVSSRETQLQEMLFESDSRNENLTNKVNDLMAEIEELQKVKQRVDPADALYSTFPEFQREQMNKIIEEQRQEIQFLEMQLQKQSDSGALEQRIAELQSHIIELEASFKLELQRAIAEQTHKDDGTGTLAVITQETSEDEILYRSERSLVNSLSRIKSSFDGLQLVELKEKFHGLQEQKNRLLEQFNLMQEEKFNLLSTINEKDILIEDLNHQKENILLEMQQLQTINSNLNSRIRQLHSQIEVLRSQLTFGSHLGFPNEQSVTRSEPFIVGESRIVHNKDIEIENLMAEIQKQKTREEELLWNIKDLQMQLQTVTENLNTLNASSMNSVLISAQRGGPEEESQRERRTNEQEGYSKERLLQNLKKNQELKELSHSLIRALKQRQKDLKQQQQLFRDLRGSQQMIQDQYSQQSSTTVKKIKVKISSLIKEFQMVKLQLIRTGGNKSSQPSTETNKKEADIIKHILGIQQALGEIKLLSETELGQIS